MGFHCGATSKATNVHGTSPQSAIQGCQRSPQRGQRDRKGLTVFVYQCIEGHAIPPPAGGEIVNVDIGVPKKHNTRHYQIKFCALLNVVLKESLLVLRK